MSRSISVKDLRKVYRYYKRPSDRLLEAVTPLDRHTEIRALDDVSFEIEQGEMVGLVGRNGSGKSTLLKILAGVAAPTSGGIETSGAVAAILELGSGFHPEFSGRANAELNAAMLGLSPAEIQERMPKILEFSELGEFLDRPVRTYSSGMVVRLGFSVAVHVDPDILLVDEALAVGDGHFQKKCLTRMREFQEQRKTIIFCSHSLSAVSATCRKTVWLEKGKLMKFGPTPEVIRAYEMELLNQEEESVRPEIDQLPEKPSPVRLRNVATFDRSGTLKTDFVSGETIVARLEIESLEPTHAIHLIIGLDRSLDQLQCASFGTHWDGLEPLSGSRRYEIELVLRDISLTPAEYKFNVFAGDESVLHLFDRSEVGFSITGEGDPGVLFELEHEWR